MPFAIPSMSEFRTYVVALGRALLPTKNWDPDSFYGRLSTFIAGVTSQLHAHVDSAQRDTHPLTAGDGKPIESWGEVLGTRRKGATASRRLAAGRVRGAAGSTVVAGTQLVNPNTGLLYQIANPSDITIPGSPGDPDGFFDADISALATGSQTRMIAGEVLQFLSPPAGIESQVVLQLDLDEDGFDREGFGPYRERVLDQFRIPPAGGNQADYVKWAIEALPAVSRAYAYPNRAGLGTMDVVAFYAGNGASRSLTMQDRAAVAAYIRTKATFSIAATGGPLRVLPTIADGQRIEILLEPNGVQAYEFHWPAPPEGIEVDSYDASIRELVVVGTLPATLRAGHLLILVGTVAGSGLLSQDGREYKVESISGSNSVILEKAPPVDPQAGDLIYSGGPLVRPVRDAIVGHVNGETVYAGRGQIPVPESAVGPRNPAALRVQGLDILAEGMGSANPGGRYNGPAVRWSGGLLRPTLFKIASYKQGVRNATVLLPTADYEAEDDKFPNDEQIHYIAPSVVIVRRYL